MSEEIKFENAKVEKAYLLYHTDPKDGTELRLRYRDPNPNGLRMTKNQWTAVIVAFVLTALVAWGVRVYFRGELVQIIREVCFENERRHEEPRSRHEDAGRGKGVHEPGDGPTD